uniref:Phospholipase A2-like central domain-containing protein n=1 Tax=Junco hyemalis TaxID=40217 RepID=A0A8C5ITH4_JUNHY
MLVCQGHSTLVCERHSTLVCERHRTLVCQGHSTLVCERHSTLVCQGHSTLVCQGHRHPLSWLCPRRLKQCLRRVNDTASRAVGQAFFNVIQVPCFEFTYREECVEPYLYVWCRAYNTVAVAVPREPVLYEFGGELIDRAARPRGVPLSPPWDHHELPGDHHTGTAPKAGKKERKRKKDKKNKGKGLKKKGSSEKGARSHPAGPADPWALLPSSNTILSDAPAREGAGREPVPATPSPVPTTSGKRRRKERNRKKRLKSKTEAEPARELQL